MSLTPSATGFLTLAFIRVSDFSLANISRTSLLIQRKQKEIAFLNEHGLKEEESFLPSANAGQVHHRYCLMCLNFSFKQSVKPGSCLFLLTECPSRYFSQPSSANLRIAPKFQFGVTGLCCSVFLTWFQFSPARIDLNCWVALVRLNCFLCHTSRGQLHFSNEFGFARRYLQTESKGLLAPAGASLHSGTNVVRRRFK